MIKIFTAAALLTALAAAAAAQVPDHEKGTAAAPREEASPATPPAPAAAPAADKTPDSQEAGRRAPEFFGLPPAAGGTVLGPGPGPQKAPPPFSRPARDKPSGRAAAGDSSAGAGDTKGARPGFRWRPAFEQSLLFLSVQHGYALTQPKTRRDLSGSFFKDYARSVRSLGGWGDGGRFFTNYVAHPMQGSVVGFVYVQNDPAAARQRFGASGAYWRSRMKALAWSAAWSTQFEIGPVSQASIGNVGLHGKQTYVDLIMTPTAGLGLLVAEDALDRYVIERLERRGRFLRIVSRVALNPTRTGANLLRFKKPWHRDAAAH